jgi:DNA-binding protein WhiA
MASYAAELRRLLAAETSVTGGSRSSGSSGASGKRSPLRTAELAGLVDGSSGGGRDLLVHPGPRVDTTSASVARSAARLLRSEFGLEPALDRQTVHGSFGRSRYVVSAEGNRALQAASELWTVRAALGSGAASREKGTAYLRGAFQVAGSVTAPGYRRGHHLEFSHHDEGFVRLAAGLSRASLTVVRRRSHWVAYTKSADGVTTVLSQLGLHDAVLDYEARAIVGEAKANANRVTNFDAANAGRVARSAAAQQEALGRLDSSELPGALREMLDLRLENPDASLSELARLGGLTKSAANHRLRRLVHLAGR